MRAFPQLACAAAVAVSFWSAPSSAAQNETCETIAVAKAADLRDQLMGFAGKVFGKEASRWTKADFDNFIANVFACNGYKGRSGYRVDAAVWPEYMAPAMKVVIPVSTIIDAAVAASGGKPVAGRPLPECVSLLYWRRDVKTRINNSAEIFGSDFSAMDETSRATAARFARACAPALEKVVEARRYKVGTADQIVADMVSEAGMEDAAAAEDVTDRLIVARVRGRLVPLAMLGNVARQMVEEAEAQATISGPFPPEAARRLVTWADGVISVNRDDAERAYAEAVKKVITSRIFEVKPRREADGVPDSYYQKP